MRKLSLYAKLAKKNMKTNYRLYVPFLCACIGIVMLMYHMTLFASADNIRVNGSSISQILGMGFYVLAIVATFFLLYINGFLMKQRGKEFGLYSILGMGKTEIATILFMEDLFSYLISIAGGIGLGIALAKIIQLMLLRLIHLSGNIELKFTPFSFFVTILLFFIIFVLKYIQDLWRIKRINLIDLFTSDKEGEKIPKNNWILGILGFVLLGIGYYKALTTKTLTEAYNEFFLAVGFVIVGTILLFVAGSSLILKTLKKNKKIYYRKHAFINISSLIYRLGQNAMGLSQICIFSCMVIVTISMVVSLYSNCEQMIAERYERDVEIMMNVNDTEQADEFVSFMNEVTEEYVPKNIVSYEMERLFYMNIHGSTMNISSTESNECYIYSIDDYNQITGDNVELGEHEVVFYNSSNAKFETLNINGIRFSVRKQLNNEVKEMKNTYKIMGKYWCLFVKDIDECVAEIQNDEYGHMTYASYLFNTGLSDDEKKSLSDTICDQINSSQFGGYSFSLQTTAFAKQNYYSTYGGLLFVGSFLGIVFLMATVLVIYYKQVSEGYEDVERYKIMQQIGMSKEEVKQTINSQVLIVFFFPLVVTFIHMIFARNIVYQLSSGFGLTDMSVFMRSAGTVMIIFTIHYILIYKITSRTYYHIVQQ